MHSIPTDIDDVVIYPDGSVQRLDTNTGVSSLKRRRSDAAAGGATATPPALTSSTADPLKIITAVANPNHIVQQTIQSSLSTLSDSGEHTKNNLNNNNNNSFTNNNRSNNNNNGNNNNVTRNENNNGIDEDYDDESDNDDDIEVFKRLKVQMSRPLVPVIDLT